MLRFQVCVTAITASLLGIGGCDSSKLGSGASTEIGALAYSGAVGLKLSNGIPTQYPAGECLALTVSVIDEYENTVPLTSSTTVTINANSTLPSGSVIFQDSGCSVPNSSYSLSQGDIGVTVFFRATVSQNYQLSFSSGSLSSANHNLQVGFGNQLVHRITGPTAPMTAGVCSGPYLAQSSDLYGNAVPVIGPTVDFLEFQGDLKAYNSAGCSNEITFVTIPAGSHVSGSFFLANTTAETAGINVAGFPTQQLLIQTIAGLADNLGADGPNVSPVGACVPLTVSIIDQFGNPTPYNSDLGVNLSTNSFSKIYSDPACLTEYISTMNPSIIPTGSNSLIIYGQRTQPGTLTLNANTYIGGIYRSVQFQLDFLTNPPAALGFNNPASALPTINTCTPLRIEMFDSGGNFATSSTAIGVTLASTAGAQLDFFSSSSCSTTSEISTTTIPANLSYRVLYFKVTENHNQPTVDITASATGLTSGVFVITPSKYTEEVHIQWITTGVVCTGSSPPRHAAGHYEDPSGAVISLFPSPVTGFQDASITWNRIVEDSRDFLIASVASHTPYGYPGNVSLATVGVNNFKNWIQMGNPGYDVEAFTGVLSENNFGTGILCGGLLYQNIDYVIRARMLRL